MPPWGPVKGVGEFHGDPSLSLPEIDMFITWVEGGAPEGDPAWLPSRLPSAPPPAVPLKASRSIDVASTLTLASPLTLRGLTLQGLRDTESLEAWAVLRDGSVERLIWLPDFRTAARRDFRLQSPLRLPRGTRIQLRSAPAASLRLLGD